VLEVAAAQQTRELGGDEAGQGCAVVLDALEEGRQVLGDEPTKVARGGLPRDVRDGSARAHARP
jgi:hypothetical protein